MRRAAFMQSFTLPFFVALACCQLPGTSQAAAEAVQVAAAATLPGKGLAQHPFLYCGEYQYDSEQQTLHLIEDGKEVWSYGIKFHVLRNDKEDIQELGDCTRLSNGNIVFTTRFGAAEVTPEKTIIWQYLAPGDTEIHSLQVLDADHVLLVQNGNPAKALTINMRTNAIEKTFILHPAKPEQVHGQFRRVHLTSAGTYLVAQMDMDKVIEYAADGNAVWSVNVPSPWDAVRVKNGHTLVSSNNGFVRELDSAGTIVWEFTQADASYAGYVLKNVQEVTRLANGNTLISNWVAGSLKPDRWPSTVQFLEVTPDKHVVWALSKWDKPNLGPATSLQLLDEPGRVEAGDLQR